MYTLDSSVPLFSALFEIGEILTLIRTVEPFGDKKKKFNRKRSREGLFCRVFYFSEFQQTCKEEWASISRCK